MKKIIAIVLLFSVIFAAGCIQSPREEAISIAMQVPEFKEASEQGDIVFSEEGGVWVVKVTRRIGNETIDDPVVFIDSETRDIMKVYVISKIEAEKIALLEWWKDRVMIPEQKAVAVAEDKRDHWLVTIQIVNMFTGEIISENAGEYRIDKATGRMS
ncbi:MAG: hypothetical protein BME93_05485 [Methanosarcinales archaeon Met12]|nr:MAG: hypothetical protein BME93_05485 [Methanosarcinales archaeon Met12]